MMKSALGYRMLLKAVPIAILLAAVACGPAAAPTPTPPKAPAAPTATATTAPAPAAPTATPTRAPAATVAAVATPTPTARAIPTPTSAGPQPKRGGVARAGIRSETVSFNIDFLNSSRDIQYHAKFYNGLLTYTPQGELIPDLAVRWDWIDSGKGMRFELRKGVKFHDGSPLTSADVVWSLNKMMGRVEGHSASSRVGLLKDYVAEVVADGPDIVVIRLNDPAPFVPYILGADHAGVTKKDTTTAMLKSKPYGTGPFRFVSKVEGSVWTTDRYPNYHIAGRPYLDGIEFLIFANDQVAIAAVIAGKSDWYYSTNPMGQDLISIIEKTPTAAWEGKIRAAQRGIGFNLVTENHFRDLRVRQAVNLAFDRQAALASVGNAQGGMGFLWPADFPVWGRPLAEILATPGWRQPKDADVATARRLMVDAGYANGFDTVCDTDGGSSGRAQFEWMVLEFREKLNIRCIPKIHSAAESDALAIAFKLTLGAQSAAISGAHTFADPDEVFGISLTSTAPRNVHGYKNPSLDKLAAQIRTEIDPVKRKALTREAEDIVMADLPGIILFNYTNTYTYQKRLKGPPGAVGGWATSAYVGNRMDQLWLDPQ